MVYQATISDTTLIDLTPIVPSATDLHIHPAGIGADGSLTTAGRLGYLNRFTSNTPMVAPLVIGNNWDLVGKYATSDPAATRYIIVRGLTATPPNPIDLDVNGTTSVGATPVTLNTGSPFSIALVTANDTIISLPRSVVSESSQTVYPPVSTALLDSDLFTLTNQVASPPMTRQSVVATYELSPTAPVFLPDPMSTPTVDVLDESHGLYKMNFVPVGSPNYYKFYYFTGSGGNVVCHVSAAWLGNSPNAYSSPDLSAVPGFEASTVIKTSMGVTAEYSNRSYMTFVRKDPTVVLAHLNPLPMGTGVVDASVSVTASMP